MPHHAEAQAIADAIENSVDVDALARAWLEQHAADVTEPWWYDVGAGGKVLVIWPGWGPLDPPLDFIKIGRRGD